MENIKNSFLKIGEDIFYLNEELEYLKQEFGEMNEKISEIHKIILNMPSEKNKTHKEGFQTKQAKNQTDKSLFKPLKGLNEGISIGNGGASTDRQTDRQTDKQVEEEGFSEENSIDSAADMLNSLDNIKKELRLKFKRLTEQEMLIFSTIYQLDEEKGHSTYKDLSKKLNLTESSMRDYVRRLVLKGIPVIKSKVNNKEIHLNISPNLKKITSLNTLLELREL